MAGWWPSAQFTSYSTDLRPPPPTTSVPRLSHTFFFLVFYAEVEGREKGTTAEHGVEKGGWEKGRNVKMKVKNWQRVQESIKNNLSVPGGSHSR